MLVLTLLFNLVRSAFASCPRSLNQSPSCIPSAETTSLVVDVLPQRSRLYFNPLRVKEEAIWDKIPAVFLHLKLQVLCTNVLLLLKVSEEMWNPRKFSCALGSWHCCLAEDLPISDDAALGEMRAAFFQANIWMQSEDVKADTAFVAQGSALRQRFLASMAMNSRVSPCSWIVSLFHSTWSLVS